MFLSLFREKTDFLEHNYISHKISRSCRTYTRFFRISTGIKTFPLNVLTDQTLFIIFKKNNKLKIKLILLFRHEKLFHCDSLGN